MKGDRDTLEYCTRWWKEYREIYLHQRLTWDDKGFLELDHTAQDFTVPINVTWEQLFARETEADAKKLIETEIAIANVRD